MRGSGPPEEAPAARLVFIQAERLACVQPLLPGAFNPDHLSSIQVRRNQLQNREAEVLRVALSKESPPFKVSTNEELAELCKAMAAMAGHEISATDQTVELNQSPANVLAAIEAATKEHAELKK